MDKCRVSPTWHYLEDFWTCGPPAPSTLCHNNLDHMLTICDELGFATNPQETVLPCTQLELLGVELDSVAQEAGITETSLGETIDMLYEWRLQSSCTKRQLQSLIGKQLYLLSLSPRQNVQELQNVQRPSHHIWLGYHFLKDLNWWLLFLQDWNGKSMFYDEQWLTSSSCTYLTGT